MIIVQLQSLSTALEGRITVAVNNTCPTPLKTKLLSYHIWHHMCLILNQTTIFFYFDDETYSLKLADMKYCFKPLDDNGVQIIMGDNQKTLGFSGKMGGIRYYERQLTQSEVLILKSCKSGPADFQNISHTTLIGEVTKGYQVLEGFCELVQSEFIALFRACNDHQSAQGFCKTMGGRLINMTDDIDTLVDEITKCRDVTDDNLEIWTDNMADEKHGFVIIVTKTKEGHMHYTAQYRCFSSLTVTACILPFGKNIYLKKLDFEEEFSFFSYHNRLVLQRDSAIIYRDKCPANQIGIDNESDCLVFKRMGQISGYSKFTFGHYILGRREWKNQGMKGSMPITISTCNNSSFTCDSGECIPLEYRCNGQPNCDDNSDEGQECQTLETPPASYWKSSCPENSPYINLHVVLCRVNTVSLETNEFGVTLSIVTSWRDKRLIFLSLNGTKQLNPKEYQQIWTPTINFPNAKYEDNLNMRTKNTVLEDFYVKAEGQGKSMVDNSYEVMTYNGSDVSIHQSIEYLFTFSCTYDFSTFPFDMQECYMNISLQPVPGCYPKWNVDNGLLVYGNSSTVSMYSISEIRFLYNTSVDEVRQIDLLVILSRNYQAFLLTTFLPCFFLSLLSVLTLTHFQINAFTDRITITISLLIVIASLFSQLSSTLPTAPTTKLVDYFFLYCILKVGCVFILHSFIEMALRGCQKDDNKEEFPQSDIGNIITMKDPSLDINMKIAWMNDSKEQPHKSQSNIPRLVNNIGVAAVMVIDVVVLAFFAYWVISDHWNKTAKLNVFNFTDANMNPQD